MKECSNQSTNDKASQMTGEIHIIDNKDRY